MAQLHHRTVMQMLCMQATTSAHLLLCLGIALIKLIGMSFHLSMHGLLPEDVVGVVIGPGQKFRGGQLSSLQHIA